MPADNTSVRLSILRQMKQTFEGLVNNLPPDDPMGFQFSTVAIGPLADFDQRKRLSMGIAVGSEQTAYKFEMSYSLLLVNLEVRLTVNRDDNAPGDMLEQIITMVKRVVMANRSWNGLAIDTKIVGTEVDLLTYFDRSAAAAVALQVQYRTNFLDPRLSSAGQ